MVLVLLALTSPVRARLALTSWMSSGTEPEWQAGSRTGVSVLSVLSPGKSGELLTGCSPLPPGEVRLQEGTWEPHVEAASSPGVHSKKSARTSCGVVSRGVSGMRSCQKGGPAHTFLNAGHVPAPKVDALDK